MEMFQACFMQILPEGTPSLNQNNPDSSTCIKDKNKFMCGQEPVENLHEHFLCKKIPKKLANEAGCIVVYSSSCSVLCYMLHILANVLSQHSLQTFDSQQTCYSDHSLMIIALFLNYRLLNISYKMHILRIKIA